MQPDLSWFIFVVQRNYIGPFCPLEIECRSIEYAIGPNPNTVLSSLFASSKSVSRKRPPEEMREKAFPLAISQIYL